MGNIQCIVIFIYRGFLELSTGKSNTGSVRFDSYPQVYPQIDLTDYIFRHSNSGVKWRIVEYRAFIRRRT
jgi:hypothetical protein